MPTVDPERLLAMLRDPNVESQEIAAATGVPREEAGRASRLLLTLARAKPEEFTTVPAPLAAALARAALAAGRADVLAALATHPGKDVAKEAKRGLHVLRSRGVEVPEPPRAAPAPAPVPAAEPPLPAYASAIDGRGERAFWIARAVPGKGIEVAQAVTSDERGLVELQLGALGRKEWRAFARELLARGATMGVAEVTRERAAAAVAAARSVNSASGHRVPEGADRWLAALGPTSLPPDPAAAFPPLPEEEERAAVAASGQLHALPLLRSWLADEDFLRALATRLDEVAVSPLYLDERQRAEQEARLVADAVEAYLDAPRRARLAARLFAVAEHLQDRGDAASARLAAAAARALAAGHAAAQIPFARLLVEKAFPAVPSADASAAPAAAPAAGGSPLILPPR